VFSGDLKISRMNEQKNSLSYVGRFLFAMCFNPGFKPKTCCTWLIVITPLDFGKDHESISSCHMNVLTSKVTITFLLQITKSNKTVTKIKRIMPILSNVGHEPLVEI